MDDPGAVWSEYAYLVLVPVLVSLAMLIMSRIIRAAVGRWFYGD